MYEWTKAERAGEEEPGSSRIHLTAAAVAAACAATLRFSTAAVPVHVIVVQLVGVISNPAAA